MPSGRLHQALLSAFSLDELRILAAHDLDTTLDNVVAVGPLAAVVHEVIAWAQRTGRLDDLVRAAARSRPNNALVQAAAAEHFAAAAAAPVAATAYDGPRRGRLRATLLEQFPKRSDLAMLLDDTLGQDLDAVVAASSNHTEAVFELTRWLGIDLPGRLQPFLAEAMKRRPAAAELGALYAELFA